MAARYLILQPAFLGDAILTLPLIGALRDADPNAEVHWVVRQSTEELFTGHPWVSRLWPWDKSWKGWATLYTVLRSQRWAAILTVHRYFRMGLLGRLLPAATRVTFDKNPLAWAYTHRVSHVFAEGIHEVDRNLALLRPLRLMGRRPAPPWLFPPASAWQAIKPYLAQGPFLIVAPTSRWPTKEAPFSLWEAFLRKVTQDFTVYLTGAPSDRARLEALVLSPRVQNLSGRLSLLEVAALIAHAYRVFTVDSATTHMASAMGTPTTTVFCATVPAFGFGPLAPRSRIVEVAEALSCRPCGLHGHQACPAGHFRCGWGLKVEALLESL